MFATARSKTVASNTRFFSSTEPSPQPLGYSRANSGSHTFTTPEPTQGGSERFLRFRVFLLIMIGNHSIALVRPVRNRYHNQPVGGPRRFGRNPSNRRLR
jgi:hypothetical protein